MPTKKVTFTGTTFGDVANTVPDAKWIPPKTDGIESLYIPSKYTPGTVGSPGTGIWREIKEVKNLESAGFASQTLNASMINTLAYLNLVNVLYMKSGNTGSGSNATADRTKAIRGVSTNNRKTATWICVFALQTTVPLTDTRILFTVASSTGQTISIHASGLNSKLAVEVNGTRTELATTVTSNVNYKIHVTYDNGTLKVYVNGVLDGSGTLTGLNFVDFTGYKTMGSNNIGSNSNKFHGFFAFWMQYVVALTPAEITANTAYLTNLFT